MNLRYLTIAFTLCSSTAKASSDSNGSNGIDSIATHLSGTGVAIGQAELNRPGKPMYDTAIRRIRTKRRRSMGIVRLVLMGAMSNYIRTSRAIQVHRIPDCR